MAERPNKHRTVAVDVDAVPIQQGREFPWPWWVVTVLGTLAVLGAGWLLMAASAALGWLMSPASELEAALGLSSDVLLLAHGVPVVVAGQPVSIMPLGFSLMLVLLAHPVAALAAGQALRARSRAGGLPVDGQGVVARVAGTMALTQGVGVGLLALGLGVPGGGPRGLLGGVVLGAVAGLWGASRAVRFDYRQTWPAWLRSVPTAMRSAVLVCLVGGAGALSVALIVHRDRIMDLHQSLDPGVAGTVILVLVQLLYLPNLVLWATSWVLGAGITLGDDSLISMAVTDVGFLPAIPVFGAVGDAGFGGGALYWWLSVGVVAGLVAALVVGIARRRARFDETALVGGLSGVVAGLLITLLCSLASGGLGEVRLAHVGATTDQLIIVAPALLGLSGLVSGAVLGLVRRPPRPEPITEDVEEEPQRHPDP